MTIFESSMLIKDDDDDVSSSSSSPMSHTHTTQVPLDKHVKSILHKDLLDDHEIAYFYDQFLKLDVYDNHRVTIPQFYTYIEERRTELGDALFDILGYDSTNDQGMTFGEFLLAIVTICMMEKNEVLQMIFYIFDKDKNGFISRRELRCLLRVFREVLEGRNGVLSWRSNDLTLDQILMPKDGLLEFDELCRLIKSNKSMSYAAFSLQASFLHAMFPKCCILTFSLILLQNKMMTKFKGHSFWRRKKCSLGKLRKEELNQLYAYRMRKDKAYNRCRARALRRRLGFFTYYFRVLFRRPLSPGIKIDQIEGKTDTKSKAESDQCVQEKPIGIEELLANIHSSYRNSIYPIHRPSGSKFQHLENIPNLKGKRDTRSYSHFDAMERKNRLMKRRTSQPLKKSLSLLNISDIASITTADSTSLRLTMIGTEFDLPSQQI